MRCGLIRHGADLPSPGEQARFVNAVECDKVFDFKIDALTAKAVAAALATLHHGDRLRVANLAVISPHSGQLVRMMRGMAEIGVIFEVSDGAGGELVIEPEASVRSLLHVLTMHGSGRRAADSSGRIDRRPHWTAEDFSEHQVAHARTLYGEGRSLREIGMIFLTSPEEVWKVVSR